MRRALLLILLIAPALALAAATPTVYRWVDSHGVVHFSDQPHPGAKKVKLSRLSIINFKTSKQSASLPPLPATSNLARSAHMNTKIRIVSPKPGQTLRPANWRVPVSVQISHGLHPDEKLIYVLDGKVIGKPMTQTHLVLHPVYRGKHELTVQAVGKSGTIITSSSVTFYVHHPSVLLHPGKHRPGPPSNGGGRG